MSRQRKWGVQIPNSQDILDVWFDSGCAFLMYDKPADLYIEGSDQHRGWFQSSTIIAAMLDRVPTNQILTHGFIVDENGEKFSKSKGGYSSLEDLFDKYNPDVMRLWVLMSDYKNDVVFSEDSFKSASSTYFKMRNLVRYWVNNLHRKDHSFELNSSLEGKLQKLQKQVEANVTVFDVNKAFRNILQFCNDYSATISEDIKNKFYESNLDDNFRVQMENEFYTLAHRVSAMLFPFMPFFSVEILESLKNI